MEIAWIIKDLEECLSKKNKLVASGSVGGELIARNNSVVKVLNNRIDWIAFAMYEFAD